MREALFIKRNADKWKQYQHENTDNPDEQADRFITLLDDLAYSKTFYPQSKVTRWINGIAVHTYNKIYQNRKEKYARLRTFWVTELPLTIRKYHPQLLFTFAFFALSVFIGVVSSSTDPAFVKGILGEEYVAMTEDNIANGDPFGVYRDDDRFSMFMAIAFNNIKVAFRTFAYGIFFGIGSIWILFYNGIMVGAFEQMFFARGFGWQSILVIWIHGTIEILSIVIAGAAGIISASGILFPGTFTRFQAFKKAIRDALKIILALVPLFVIAALLESYVTYLMSNNVAGKKGIYLPTWLAAGILLLSLTFMVWYFVWYPILLEKQKKKLEEDTPLHPDNALETLLLSNPEPTL